MGGMLGCSMGVVAQLRSLFLKSKNLYRDGLIYNVFAVKTLQHFSMSDSKRLFFIRISYCFVSFVAFIVFLMSYK